MKKKIIIGIIITVIISLTAFGTVYAYQKETSKLENSTVQGKFNLDQYSRGRSEDCDEHSLQDEEDRLMSEERNRNNIRLRKLNNPESECEDGEENRYQHRYEDQDSAKEHSGCEEDCEGDCEENRQFKNQNNNGRNRKETR